MHFVNFLTKAQLIIAAIFSTTSPSTLANASEMQTIGVGARAVSQNGERIALGYSNGLVQIIDASNGKILTRIDNASSAELGIASLSFDHSSQRLAIGDWDDNISIWDLEKNRKLASSKVKDTPESLFFSQNNKKMGVISDEGLELFDARLKRRIAVDQNLRSGFQWSDDWQNIAIWGYGDDDNYLINVYDANDISLLQSIETKQSIDSTKFINQNQSLVALDSDSFTQWSIDSGAVQKSVEVKTYGGIYLNDEGDKLITYYKNTWDVRDVDSEEIISENSLPSDRKIGSIDFSSNHNFYVIDAELDTEGYHFEREAYIYRDLNSKPIKFKPLAKQASYQPKLLANELVLFSAYYPAEVWDLNSGELRYRVFLDASSNERTLVEDINIQRPPLSIGSDIHSLTISPDSQSLLVGSAEFPNLSIMNFEGKFEAFVPIDNGVEAIQTDFLNNSERLVTNLGAGGVQVWDLSSMQRLSNFNFEMGAQHYALSSDQSLIAVASSIGEVKIWNLSNFELVTSFQLQETLDVDEEYGSEDFNFGGMLWIDNDEHILFAGNRGLIKTTIENQEQSLILEGDATALIEFTSPSQEKAFAVGFNKGPVYLLNQELSTHSELKHEGVMGIEYDINSNTLFTLSAYGTEDEDNYYNNDIQAWNLSKARAKSKPCITRPDHWLSKIAYDNKNETLYVADQLGTIHKLQWSGKCRAN